MKFYLLLDLLQKCFAAHAHGFIAIDTYEGVYDLERGIVS